MLELVLHVCLQNEPDKCHWEYLPSAAQTNTTCVMDMGAIAKWAGDNPKYIIEGWYCKPVGTEASL